jgi:hypothetical protein
MGGWGAEWAGDLEEEEGGCGRMRTPEVMSDGGEAVSLIVECGVSSY